MFLEHSLDDEQVTMLVKHSAQPVLEKTSVRLRWMGRS